MLKQWFIICVSGSFSVHLGRAHIPNAMVAMGTTVNRQRLNLHEVQLPGNASKGILVGSPIKVDTGHPECDALWPENFGLSYRSFAGAGATACVYFATTQEGQEVAVKVSKNKGMAMLLAWKRECGDMHMFRFDACKAGEDMLELGDAFLPTCLDVGEVHDLVMGAGKGDDLPFLVMDAAPRDPIEVVGPTISSADQKAVFSQLIAAVYALHGIGRTHNDLHGENIVLDMQQSPPALALIDFGDVVSLSEGMKDTYKRDGNAIWRWTAVIAGCGADAMWENNADRMRQAKPGLLQCLKDKWQADGDFLDALSLLIEGDIEMSEDQHVATLFNTQFVKENLPVLKPTYHWKGSDGCLHWGDQQWEDVRNEALYSDKFKCDTVPTYALDPNKACVSNPDTVSACFSTRPEVFWACGGGLDPKVPCVTVPLPADVAEGTYDGACLEQSHPAHKYAMDFNAHEHPSPQTSTSMMIATTSSSTTSSSLLVTTTTLATDPNPKPGAPVILGIAAALGAVSLVLVLLRRHQQLGVRASASSRSTQACVELA